MNFLSKTKTISYIKYLIQIYFFITLTNTNNYLLTSITINRLITIYNPLHYNIIIKSQRYLLILLNSYTISHLHTLFRILLISRLSFYTSHIIKHFFYNTQPILKLSYSNTSSNQIIIITKTLTIIITPFLYILFSYIKIIITILKIPSTTKK